MKEGEEEEETEEREEDDANRINRITVWMQHTSLPRTCKAVREEMLLLRRPLYRRPTCPVYSMSECVETRLSIALVRPEN